MGTRSNIALRRDDGRVKAIYCHSDGYPSHVGRMLEKHYGTRQDAEALVGLGDLSALYERLAPEKGENHSFSDRAEGVTIAYHRDRGEAWETARPKEYESLNAAFAAYAESDMEYFYLFDTDGKWHVCHRWEPNGEVLLKSISEAVAEEQAIAA